MSRRQHLQAKSSKTGKKSGGNLPLLFLRWVGFAACLLLTWVLVCQGRFSGRLGAPLNAFFTDLLGAARFLLPVFLVHGLVLYLKDSKGWIARTLAAVFSLGCIATVFAVLAEILSLDPAAAGGSVGARAAGMFVDNIGKPGGLILGGALSALGLQLLFGIKWGQLASEVLKVVAADYKEWQKNRQELSITLAAAKAAEAAGKAKNGVKPDAKPLNGAKPELAPVKPVDVTKAEAEKAAAKAADKPLEKLVPKEIKSEGPKVKQTQSEARAEVPPAPKDSPYANYRLPSLDILNPPPPVENRGKPTEAEIQSAISSLESALKSFEVEARVTGYAPGPVITRYELSPAPGVKVSSIVALENDIALAMRAKGIRIIAPIPGKAAVGIEIPNARPAMVVLRELLESPQAVPADAPLLTFGLGLAADGQPKGADIQKMPHLLVAGATNSGKSVAIHSMILSILFRARPDEVKFMMIDPKRLELTFYDGIPHLFDPTQAADRVGVVTSPKDASKSLNALVRLMEKRYEKFQLYGVRNIDSYNKEADKRGQPREFFIVCVIDELADLMLVAADSVEDSIQRLTQMARAVGIHLILATQRPSVDVITGVIKANLPARMALQVISKIDSKVILDSVGAEALQGKGDLLYLGAGAQKPERCQGAYVSEEEIKRVADYLKTQGKPDYPALETMAAKGGAAEDLATLGVEPLEFSQALKLVLERRRVSQDLLKSQFGSSARATNLLSALEVKELIHKPEGSNRWEIHFDQIEDYLRTHFPQVPINEK
jgi:S-DNA-T family DNA segregation ATPase FtsK/SpoIIIE